MGITFFNLLDKVIRPTDSKPWVQSEFIWFLQHVTFNQFILYP